MAESRVYGENEVASSPPMAGIITRIRVENFMCHSSMMIELGDSINFITGQNGSEFLWSLLLYFFCYF